MPALCSNSKRERVMLRYNMHSLTLGLVILLQCQNLTPSVPPLNKYSVLEERQYRDTLSPNKKKIKKKKKKKNNNNNNNK